MVFNVMGVNDDDHTKNFAFMRSEDSGWRLTPTYDVTHAHNHASQWTRHHLMAVKFEGIALEELYVVGERNDVPGNRRIVREVRVAVSEWPSFAEESEIDEETIKSVETDRERFAPR